MTQGSLWILNHLLPTGWTFHPVQVATTVQGVIKVICEMGFSGPACPSGGAEHTCLCSRTNKEKLFYGVYVICKS